MELHSSKVSLYPVVSGLSCPAALLVTVNLVYPSYCCTCSDLLERFNCPLCRACLRMASGTPVATEALCLKAGLSRLPPLPLRILALPFQ